MALAPRFGAPTLLQTYNALHIYHTSVARNRGRLHPVEDRTRISSKSGLIRIYHDYENRVPWLPFQDVDRITHDFDAV